MNRPAAITFSVVMIAAVISPVRENWKDEPRDSCPLSYYPMFSKKRDETKDVIYLVGLDASGNRHTLPYSVAGNGGFHQVRKQINKMRRTGRTTELCHRVADRIASSDDPQFQTIAEVRVVIGRYRLADYFSGNKQPQRERVLATADVVRSPS